MVTDEELHDRLEERLMSHGIYVTDFAVNDDGLHVKYQTAAQGESVPHREVGRVLNVLLDAREDGWGPTDVHGWVTDLDDDERGSWRAEAGWMRALENENLSETDFSQLVLRTI